LVTRSQRFSAGAPARHIRKVAVPVVYTDFLSMYPTVNSLMDLWSFVTAREITVDEHCNASIEAFLRRMTPDELFDPATWKHLTAFVRIVPDGDILPTRGRYTAESNDWQMALNPLYSKDQDRADALWFSLPDVVASLLLTRRGRIPKIVDAFRIEAHGKLDGLTPTKLRGAIKVDPRKQDFFKVVIEERKRLSCRFDLSDKEKERLERALKVLANAASYGIYAEMIREESERKVAVTCHGIDASPYEPRVSHPDVPGEYCFPPFASLITGAARLMLALLEHSVTKLSATYAMEDTDSMAIVATNDGGIVPCLGGPYRTSGGRTAVQALSWKQVEGISKRFVALNPYDRSAVPGSILKIEDDNFDPISGKQRQLWCLAISAKRYALFLRNKKAAPVLLRNGTNNTEDRWSKHGLGHLLNPTDPESEDRDWIARAWTRIVRKAVGLRSRNPGFGKVPAVGRVTVSSPAAMRPLESLNEGKRYADQIKPFNFLLTAQIKQLGHPLGVNLERFHLIAPYESDSRKWPRIDWVDQYTGKRHRITTAGYHGSRQTARVKTYGEVLREYEFHPESKCADTNGNPCGKQTVGLLQRRHIQLDVIQYIGKESNSLEDVESGMVQSAHNVYTEYPDPRRDEWQTKILPALRKAPLATLAKLSRLSRRMIMKSRSGRTRPHRKNQELLATILGKLSPG